MTLHFPPFKIKTYNTLSNIGLEKFPSQRYEIGPGIEYPDAILLRSHDLHDVAIPESVKAVGRAGTGVNNIPVAEYSKRGIPVFNAPGANANAVTELAIAGLLLAARNIPDAWYFTKKLEGDGDELEALVEHGKKRFSGFELAGKTLGVVGLGAIGVKVSNAATALGLKVVGFDPQMTVESAWKLSADAIPAGSLDELLSRADFVSLHVPLNEHTRQLINEARIAKMKPRATLLNFSRAAIVDEAAVIDALESSKLHAYVSDFPSRALLNHARTIVLPHLGASTAEAEDNCAAMVSQQVRDFLENGNIRRSVNFPDVNLPRGEGLRLAIANENIPSMVSQMTAALAENGLNIVNILNKSRGDYAYTLIDINAQIPPPVLARLSSIHGVLSVRIV
ncbi:3-phosphoglycerate dehydrogenase family protein [Methylomicrobium sp. Wu6]|uniref:3-phosphoglycerate dehydrogenase family protein n=1 Tax=Methylomicrobium sp. Wu6 TaxID=3107928 RepID=UPI002DD66817|nr:3-phosphoglycerate dehydrogenase family protein [Methylomicrobium sp. Wu6]MEC4746907.1 3-phosphoglycerate dehydrogenase family protein [Methylomicrobium sp. Wu6]